MIRGMQITLEAFTDAMKLAVLDRGADYVYPARETREVPSSEPGKKYETAGSGCDYRRDGEPSCLIGVTLSILGIETTPEDEDKDAGSVLLSHGVTDTLIRHAAVSAQEYQDLGVSWGEALDYYLEQVESYQIYKKKEAARVSANLVANLTKKLKRIGK